MSSVAQLARRAKKNLPVDLVATGIVDGSFTVKETGLVAGTGIQGRGEISESSTAVASSESEFDPGSVPLLLTRVTVGPQHTRQASGSTVCTMGLAGSGPTAFRVWSFAFGIGEAGSIAGAGLD